MSADKVVRRAPFSDNPRVGVRGQQTQQRILDAALRAFSEEGYHACSVERIASLARCSRITFYQYFASKEDVFRHLAGQVARQLGASTEALDPITPDVDGWAALRAWVARYAEIYARYEPVFNAYQLAAEGGDVLATVAARGEQSTATIHAKLVSTTVPARHLDPAIGLLLECLNHTLDVVGILRAAGPDAYPSDLVEVAITDVMHRTLFGLREDVNAHPGVGPAAPLEFSPGMLELLRGGPEFETRASAKSALSALLASGRETFVTGGYHSTRVDDLAEAAGVSHGVFYRYFDNKGELARILTAQAMRTIGTTIAELPDVFRRDGAEGTRALRRWLRRYNDAHASEAAMFRVWVDAALQDPTLRPEFAAPLDWGRRQMSRFLRGRQFGDVDMDAVVMVALFGVFGTRPRPAAEVEAAAQIIERGVLGRE